MAIFYKFRFLWLASKVTYLFTNVQFPAEFFNNFWIQNWIGHLPKIQKLKSNLYFRSCKAKIIYKIYLRFSLFSRKQSNI